MSIAHLMIVEDDTALREMLATALQQADFSVRCAENAQQGQSLLDEMAPDLLVLDWMLPGLSGVEWVKRLRIDDDYREIPIILITARGEEEDKIYGLESGADDFLIKPFSPRELTARVKILLRRFGRIFSKPRLQGGGIVLDTEQHRVSIDGQMLALSPMEYRLLLFFITYPEKVHSRSQLLAKVWGSHAGIEDRTVDVHIRRLRKLLEKHHRAGLLQTVRGFGYRFSETE